MSYILDALRRADAERQRGAVPGLHAQNITAPAGPAREGASLGRKLAGAGALAAVVAAIAFGVAWWRAGSRAPDAAVTVMAGPAPAFAPPGAVPMGESPAPRGDAVPPGDAAPPAAMPAPAAVPAPAADAQAPRAANGADGSSPGTVRPAATPPAVAGPAHRVAVPARGSVPVERIPPVRVPAAPQGRQAAVTATPGAVPQPAPVAAGNGGVPRIDTLPASVRAGLPRLAVGGAIYSEVPSARMLILNGQVYHEGEKPAPDTVLEQIRLKSAVLDSHGTRYEITY